MHNPDDSFNEAEKVQVEQMSKELAPVAQLLEAVVRSSDVIMIGEGNHFDADTKKYSQQIFLSLLAFADRNCVVFLELSDIQNKTAHFDYAVEYCREHGIPCYAVDTANTYSAGDPGLYPEREIAMARNIRTVLKEKPGSLGIFLGGSNHCNKNGVHINNLSEQGKNYEYPSAATLLKDEYRVGAVALHFMHKREMLAKSVDESQEILSLPGKYANSFLSQTFSSSGELHPVRHKISPDSFDMIAFFPTLEKRIFNILRGGQKKRL